MNDELGFGFLFIPCEMYWGYIQVYGKKAQVECFVHINDNVFVNNIYDLR